MVLGKADNIGRLDAATGNELVHIKTSVKNILNLPQSTETLRGKGCLLLMHKVGKLPIWGKNWDWDLSEVVERKVLKKAKQKLPEALKKKIAIIIVIVDHL